MRKGIIQEVVFDRNNKLKSLRWKRYNMERKKTLFNSGGMVIVLCNGSNESVTFSIEHYMTESEVTVECKTMKIVGPFKNYGLFSNVQIKCKSVKKIKIAFIDLRKQAL